MLLTQSRPTRVASLLMSSLRSLHIVFRQTVAGKFMVSLAVSLVSRQHTHPRKGVI